MSRCSVRHHQLLVGAGQEGTGACLDGIETRPRRRVEIVVQVIGGGEANPVRPLLVDGCPLVGLVELGRADSGLRAR